MEMENNRLIFMLRKSPWVRRRLILRSLIEKEYLLENEAEFRNAFNFLDVNKDGYITENDLCAILMVMGGKVPSQVDLTRWIRVFDMNQDSQISYEEFVATVIIKMESFMSSNDISRLFMKCDLRERGYITIDNVIQVARMLGEKITIQDAKCMFKDSTTSSKRGLDFPEFKEMMQIMRKDILFCVGAILAS